MPKSNKPWITFHPTEDEKAILDAYCYDTRQTKTDVLRQFIRSLQPPELGDNPCPRKSPLLNPKVNQTELDEINAHLEQKEKEFLLAQIVDNDRSRWGDSKWTGDDRPKAIHHDPEVREWLQSLGAEADQELADAKSLRAMTAHMLTIANRLEK